ncbi:transmembrane protein 14A isoform X5 [Struthio camelus]|uniref:transmembrane protein 14A isoform X5 n=1 Tax=Struthio camelus TaxID=8801 RepID=UPI00051E6349|nr:PREDICTED: transmembrane protein 14A isoform X5 [Struthio camelus australis]
MAIDWIGFAYAALVAVGGVLGYTRKGSKISLAAGLTFGSVAGYGAYCVTRDPRNVKISLYSCHSTSDSSQYQWKLFSFSSCMV